MKKTYLLAITIDNKVSISLKNTYLPAILPLVFLSKPIDVADLIKDIRISKLSYSNSVNINSQNYLQIINKEETQKIIDLIDKTIIDASLSIFKENVGIIIEQPIDIAFSTKKNILTLFSIVYKAEDDVLVQFEYQEINSKQIKKE